MEDIADPTSVIVLLGGNAAMREASIARCDGFCSEVLAVLTLMSEQGNMRFCRHLKNLYIRECTQFEGHSLRFFLETRLAVHAQTNFVEDGEDGYEMSSVRSLGLVDCREFSGEDQRWFEDNY
ncbi:hypothetical protein FOMPIDRAFT_1023877 [Fomitopsis schrenkii]|uniref:Uncharacterized protein n=1 Tax=Fomitopsis schrenkii TaxID=2126942 RepID=S8EAK9_FOMSC|nr:hypothetical protein FOMPIDRAFT_1023877 [Fomitopsis schrenkii]